MTYESEESIWSKDVLGAIIKVSVINIIILIAVAFLLSR